MIAKWRRLFNGTNCGNTAGWPRRAIGRNIEAPGRPRDALVFSGNTNFVRDVMVGGRWLVQDGRHIDRERIAAEYRRAIAALA